MQEKADDGRSKSEEKEESRKDLELESSNTPLFMRIIDVAYADAQTAALVTAYSRRHHQIEAPSQSVSVQMLLITTGSIALLQKNHRHSRSLEFEAMP